jgi:hypothetical protein
MMQRSKALADGTDVDRLFAFLSLRDTLLSDDTAWRQWRHGEWVIKRLTDELCRGDVEGRVVDALPGLGPGPNALGGDSHHGNLPSLDVLASDLSGLDRGSLLNVDSGISSARGSKHIA